MAFICLFRFSYTAMEEMRPVAAKKMNVTPEEINIPYDLLTLMDITSLWDRYDHKIELMAVEVICSPQIPVPQHVF